MHEGANCKLFLFPRIISKMREEEACVSLGDLGSSVAIRGQFRSQFHPPHQAAGVEREKIEGFVFNLCSKEIAWAPRSPAFSEYLEKSFRLKLKKYKEKTIGDIQAEA